MAESILITICARAGSKRLLNKNTLLMRRQPLITHTIKQAKKWANGTTVISTDSKQAMLFAIHNDIDLLLYRKTKLCEDTIPKIKVIKDVLLKSEEMCDKQFETIIDLDVTNPLRTVEHIEEAYQAFIKGDYDSLSSVVDARKNPYYSMVEIIAGKAKICKGNDDFACSQETPKVYEQNANIYIYSRNYLLDERNISDIGENTGIYIMPEWTFCDINTELDFKIVEFLMGEYLSD